MDIREQINAFNADLVAVIDRYRQEFDLPYAAVMGVLEMQKLLLAREAIHRAEEQEEDDEEEEGDE